MGYVLSFPICRSFPAVPGRDHSQLSAHAPVPGAWNQPPFMWLPEEREALSFAVFLSDWKQLAGENLDLMSPLLALVGVPEFSRQAARVAQESPRSSGILQITSYCS